MCRALCQAEPGSVAVDCLWHWECLRLRGGGGGEGLPISLPVQTVHVPRSAPTRFQAWRLGDARDSYDSGCQ